MFLFQHSDYSIGFYVLQGDADSRTCGSYHVSSESIEKITEHERTKVKEIPLMGQRLFSLVRVDAGALNDDRRSRFNGYSLFELLMFYLGNSFIDKDKVDFPQYLRTIPGLFSFTKREPTLPMIARNYEGEWLYFYVQDGKVEFTILTESVVINGGHVTPVAKLQEIALERARNLLKETEETIAKLNEQTYDLPEKLIRSGITRYAKR